MQISPTFFNTLLLGFLFFQDCVLAAKPGAKKGEGDDGGGGGGGGNGGGDSGGSDSAPPLDTAILVVGGIGAGFAALIGLASYKCCFRRVYMHNKLSGQDPTRRWNTGGAFWLLAMLGMAVLVAHYILLATQFSLAEVGDSPVIVVNAMVTLTSDMADILIASAFFSLLRRRQSIHFAETISTWKTTFKISMILLMLTFAAIKAALGCLNSTFTSESKLQALGDLFHVYTALYIVTTATIIVSAFSLRKRLMKADIEDRVVLARVCRWVCPYLAIEASFRLAYEIVIFLPSRQEQHININALILVDIIIKYSAYTWSVVVIGNDAGPRSRLRAPPSVIHH